MDQDTTTSVMSNRDIQFFVSKIERQLFLLESATTTTQEQRNTAKKCIFHITLKAIAMSKSASADTKLIRALFDLASELAVEAELTEDTPTQNRLQDLVNAIIDKDDLAVQMRMFSRTNKKLIDNHHTYIKSRLDLIIEDNQFSRKLLQENNNLLSRDRGKKSAPKMINLIIFILLFAGFTIGISIFIISNILKDDFINENNPQLQKESFITKDKDAR